MRLPRCARILGGLLAATTIIVLPGCQTSTDSAEVPGETAAAPSATAPRSMGESAPSAAEMEGALATGNSPASVSSGSMRIELDAPVQNGSRPQAPLPPISANPSPFVDESAVMPTKELHGYSFPGVNQIEPVKVAKVEPTAEAAPIDEAEVERRANERAKELAVKLADEMAQQKAELMAEGLAEEKAKVLTEQAMRNRDAEIERLRSLLEAKGVEREQAATMAAEVSAKKIDELATAKAELMAKGMAEERAKELAEELAKVRAEEIAQHRAQMMAEGLAEEKAEALAQRMIESRAQALAEQLAEEKARELAEPMAQQRAEVLAEEIAQKKAVAMAETIAEERTRLLADGMAEKKAQAMAEKIAEARAAQMAEEMVETRLAEERAAAAESSTGAGVALSDWQPAAMDFAASMNGPYRIGAGDILEFQSFSDPTLNRELTVRYDGHISLPLVEDIQVTGRTREEAEGNIRQAYTTVFKNPQLSLLVRETASKTFAVIGDIETPGVYPYLRPTTLIEAVSLAGGLRRRNSSSSVGGFVGVTGQLTKAFIIRHVEGERMVYQYDLRQIGNPGAHAGDAPIFYGDLIYIPEGVNLVYLLGESRNPVIVELTEGMTLLQMLSLSGGFDQSTARLRSVVLMREVDGDNTRVMTVNVREMLRTGKDFPLAPGDIVYIPQKWTVRLSEFIARFTGSVSPVLDMYNSAVQAYYAGDLARASLDQASESRTLQRLIEIEQFGTSTQNIVDLFGAP